MSKPASGIQEVLPKIGFLFEEDAPSTIVSKPKLMPLKTVTLEKVILIYFNRYQFFLGITCVFIGFSKLEKMQLEAEQKIRQEQFFDSQ